jgi:hypothetical protein
LQYIWVGREQIGAEVYRAYRAGPRSSVEQLERKWLTRALVDSEAPRRIVQLLQRILDVRQLAAEPSDLQSIDSLVVAVCLMSCAKRPIGTLVRVAIRLDRTLAKPRQRPDNALALVPKTRSEMVQLLLIHDYSLPRPVIVR